MKVGDLVVIKDEHVREPVVQGAPLQVVEIRGNGGDHTFVAVNRADGTRVPGWFRSDEVVPYAPDSELLTVAQRIAREERVDLSVALKRASARQPKAAEEYRARFGCA